MSAGFPQALKALPAVSPGPEPGPGLVFLLHSSAGLLVLILGPCPFPGWKLRQLPLLPASDPSCCPPCTPRGASAGKTHGEGFKQQRVLGAGGRLRTGPDVAERRSPCTAPYDGPRQPRAGKGCVCAHVRPVLGAELQGAPCCPSPATAVPWPADLDKGHSCSSGLRGQPQVLGSQPLPSCSLRVQW